MAYERLQTVQFKNLLKTNKEINSDLIICKLVDAKVSQDGKEKDRQLKFSISSEKVDRDGDTMALQGWRLDEFNKSGVVLWTHNTQMPPLAKPIKTWVEDTRLCSIGQYLPEDFADHDHVKFTDMIYKMVKAGYLKGVSVGFRPIKYAKNEERGGAWPVDYLEQELLEWSNTPVMSNTEGVHEAKAAGIDLDPLKLWAEKALDENSTGLWVPRKELENLYTGLATKTISVPETKSELKDTPKPKEKDPLPSNALQEMLDKIDKRLEIIETNLVQKQEEQKEKVLFVLQDEKMYDVNKEKLTLEIKTLIYDNLITPLTGRVQ